MLNQCNIMGRLVRDPELRRTQAGIPVVSFSLAVERDIPNRETGERGVDFIDVVAWRQIAEFVSKYFSKGRMAVVSGRLQMRQWTDDQGNKRTKLEIKANNVYFGDSKREGSPDEAPDPAAPAAPADFAMLEDDDSELPF